MKVTGALRRRYEDIAQQLTNTAEDEATVSVYISADDIAEALGDNEYDPDESPFKALREWIAERRQLGFEPTADDVLAWIDGEERADVLAA